VSQPLGIPPIDTWSMPAPTLGWFTVTPTFESGGLTVIDNVCVAARRVPSARTPRSTE
jgi:hypothetical protein